VWERFVCLGMPLYKVKAGGGAVEPEDAPKIWNAWRKMLDDFERLVPNINPKWRIVGGFSNGGNSMMHVTNYSQQFADYFSGFLFEEGAGDSNAQIKAARFKG